MVPLLLAIQLIDAVQSVALAGAFVAPTVSVQINEAGLKSAGFKAADVEGMTVTATLFQISGNTRTNVGTATLIRIGVGIWAGSVAAPTVAGGATFGGGIDVALSSTLQFTDANGVLHTLDAAKVNRITHPVRLVRASS